MVENTVMSMKNHTNNCVCSFCKNKHGKNNPNFGHRWSIEKRLAFSKQRKGKGNPFYGKKQTKRHRDSILVGSLCGWWKGGVTSLINKIRCIQENVEWRKKVFERDNYTCQKCGKKGHLEAHHITSFRDIFYQFLKHYSQFSPLEDKLVLIRLAIMYKPFWDISNGLTLCRTCHDETKEGARNAKK